MKRMENSTLSESPIIVYGTKWCGDCRRSIKLLKEKNTLFTFIDIDQDKEGEIFVKSTNHGNRSVPTIIFPDGSILVEPGNVELIKRLEGTKKSCFFMNSFLRQRFD